tara:strand:- start:133 stop:579 length:447 start_codon:yes stop_codon:yes gene_type:complete
MVSPKRVGHLVLNVKNVQKSTQFYTEVLGFQVALQKKDATFLTCGKIHHDLALFQASPMATPVTKGGLGLNHMALQVENFDMLTQYYHMLKDREAIDRTTDHGMTSSIYLTDPDGNGIELFCNNQDNPADGLSMMGDSERQNTELIFS